MQDLNDSKNHSVQQKRAEGIHFKAGKVPKSVEALGLVTSEVKEIAPEQNDWKRLNHVLTMYFGHSPISDVCLVKGSIDEMYIVHQFERVYKVSIAGFVRIPNQGNDPFGISANGTDEILMTAADRMVYRGMHQILPTYQNLASLH